MVFLMLWSKWTFLSKEILELLSADNSVFTEQRSGSGLNFFNIFKKVKLHWAPVSILHETGIPLEVSVIDQSEFPFFIYLICTEFRKLIVLIENS